MIAFFIVGLALAGLIISVYFTFAYYGRIKKSRWVPEILCAREGSSCVTVVQTPYARVFGVPNSLLGIVYYLLLIAWGTTFPSVELVWNGDDVGVIFLGLDDVLMALSVGTVLLGFYLIYALRRKLHIDCPLCYTAHAINLAIFVLLFRPNW